MILGVTDEVRTQRVIFRIDTFDQFFDRAAYRASNFEQRKHAWLFHLTAPVVRNLRFDNTAGLRYGPAGSLSRIQDLTEPFGKGLWQARKR